MDMNRRGVLGGMVAFVAAGAMSIPGMASATADQEAAITPLSGDGHELRVRMMDGRTATIWFRDLGTTIPGYDRNGGKFDAYTTYYRFDDGREFYTQVDCALADMASNINDFRMSEDIAFLEFVGVDPSSL